MFIRPGARLTLFRLKLCSCFKLIELFHNYRLEVKLSVLFLTDYWTFIAGNSFLYQSVCCSLYILQGDPFCIAITAAPTPVNLKDYQTVESLQPDINQVLDKLSKDTDMIINHLSPIAALDPLAKGETLTVEYV